MIFLILSLIHYWAGNIKEELVQEMMIWTPAEIDDIPLREWAEAPEIVVLDGDTHTDENA